MASHYTNIVGLAVAALILGSSASLRSDGAVTVYAAASLVNVLESLDEELSDVTLRLSVGGSSTLAKQIEHGAPADLFLSANADWMDYLQARDLIEAETRSDLIGNAVALVALKGSGFLFRAERDFDLPNAFRGRLAIADPNHVPAGLYARQALEALGWWERLSRRLVPAVDVRGALSFVERGECSAGIVYVTDAAMSDRVVVLGTFPESLHDPVVYPMAVVRGRETPNVTRVLSALRANWAGEVVAKHGFRRSQPGSEEE